MNRLPSFLLALAFALVAAGCGGEDAMDGGAGGSADTAAGSAGADRYLLEGSGPTDAVSVEAAHEAEPGERIAVVGRVQKMQRPHAMVVLFDDSLEYCGRGNPEDDHCPTPWDYCCVLDKVGPHSTIPVEIRGADGRPVKSDTLDVRLLDLLVVEGTLEETESGGLLLVTEDGWHRRERPELGDHVDWP